MARKKRAVLTAPSYAIQHGTQAWTSSMAFQPVKPHNAMPIANEEQPHRGMLSDGEAGAMGDQAGVPCHAEHAGPSIQRTCCSPNSQHHLTGQMPWRRRQWHVQYVAICPHHLEPLARQYMAELSAAYHSLGLGTHLPAPACTHLRRIGGIAPVPPDTPMAPAAAQHIQQVHSTQGAARDMSPQPAGVARGPGVTSLHNPGIQPSIPTGKSPGAHQQHAFSTQDAPQSCQSGRTVTGPIIHPHLGVIVNSAAGPADGAPPSTLGSLKHHGWSDNYHYTLAALQRSIQDVPSVLRGTRAHVTLVYVVSPTDEREAAMSCLLVAAQQLSPLRSPPTQAASACCTTSPQPGIKAIQSLNSNYNSKDIVTLGNSNSSGCTEQQVQQQPADEHVTAAVQHGSHMVGQGREGIPGGALIQQHMPLSSDCVGHMPEYSNIVIQVLCPGLMRQHCSSALQQAALAVYTKVDGSCVWMPPLREMLS